MAKIELQALSVEFPVYNVNARSFKNQFLRLATGGAVVKDATHRVIVKALKDINLTLQHGDNVGLIGHNGAGKSTFLRLLAGIYEPTQGQITIQGKVSTMLDVACGIEGEFTGYENISMRGILLGLSPQQIKDKTTEIANFSGLGDYLNMPVRTYSSGMMVRLAFAISTSIEPDIFLVDEIFTAGDAAFMEKAKQQMISLLNKSSIVVMASHNNDLLQEFCNKGLVLEQGHVKFFGPMAEALQHY